MKYDRYSLTGALCLLPFVFVGAFLTTPSALHVFSWVLLSLGVMVGDLVCFDLILTHRRRNWCVLIPFTVLFLYTKFALGWNVLLPFFAAGQMALGVYTTLERAETNGKLKAAKPLLIATAASLTLGCVAILTGVMA